MCVGTQMIDVCNRTQMFDVIDSISSHVEGSWAWNTISMQPPNVMPTEFIFRFNNKLNWTILSIFYPLTIETLQHFSHLVNWFYMFKCKQFPTFIIEDFEYNYREDDDVWYIISKCQRYLTEEFILKYHKKLHMDLLDVTKCFRMIHSELFQPKPNETFEVPIEDDHMESIGNDINNNYQFTFLIILIIQYFTTNFLM